jgi:hypothetical protein
LSHIDEGSLELYALGRVSPFEVVAIEEHLLVCPYCKDRFTPIQDFAIAARNATQVMATELVDTHSTSDGLVHLYVRRTGVKAWVATIRGEAIGGGVTAKTRHEAVMLCVSSFREMFPEHRCGRRCSNAHPDAPSS